MSETERQQRIQQQSEATGDVEASEDEDDEGESFYMCKLKQFLYKI